MGNVYSAQNFAAYFIYELNEKQSFVNAITIQHLLAEVEEVWQNMYGHSAFKESKFSLREKGYVVKEVFEAYKDNRSEHITLPAKEWHLPYGQFQLIYRTYGIPPFTKEEEKIIQSLLRKYQYTKLKNAS